MVVDLEKTMAIEAASNFDDDGRVKRTGTLMTASAHIITVVIGSGVLSLSWALAQLGWLVGPLTLVIFAIITWYTSTLLADSYRCNQTGNRNITYTEVVKNYLGGGIKSKICGFIQYAFLTGSAIGYLLTASISMAAIKRSSCFHENGHDAGCHTTNNMYMIIFAVTMVLLSQIPNFHKLSGLSVIAAIMSFAYSTIGIGLAIAKIAEGSKVTTSIKGTQIGVDVTFAQKIWLSFQAIGNVAFSYAYSSVIIEIEDTLKSSPPENVVMKKSCSIGVSVTTVFYLLCGTLGYAAFGNNAPGNFLTGFGFYEPFWLIDIANICIVIHLVGAYQVYSHPTFSAVENWFSSRWPESKFITKGYPINIPFCGVLNLNMLRLIWRTLYVVATTLVAMIFPFFNSILGLLGAAAYWPLTVYFPIEVYMSRTQVRRFSMEWFGLMVLVGVCLIVSAVAAVSSVEGLIVEVTSYKLFQAES